MFAIANIESGKLNICREVLDDLPNWFGIPESKAEYVDEASGLPMIACLSQGELAGFIAIKRQTEFAADLFVLGVKRRFHRKGVGRALIDEAARYAFARLFLSDGKNRRRLQPGSIYAIT